MISAIVDVTFDFIILILIIGCVLTFIPNIKWYDEPFKTIKQFCDFFFSPFRKLIPALNGLDFSPIIAFFVIRFAGNLIVEILRGMNL